MAVSRKSRHWMALALALAIVWTVLATVQFADFAGDPAPRWRTVALTALVPICLGVMVLNMTLDGREASDDFHPGNRSPDDGPTG